jgi:asparaginyl-tRNA synthetase
LRVTSSCAYVSILAELYTSDKTGSDESGDGSEARPFKTILQAMRHASKEPFPVIYVDAKEQGQVNKMFTIDSM